MRVIDNYLSEELFAKIKELVSDNYCPWYLVPYANDDAADGDYQFMHQIIKNGEVKSSGLTWIVDEIMRPLLPIDGVYRARINLFPKNSDVQRGIGFHTDDEDDKYTTLLMYLEDSNGYTEFIDGTKVESVANRALIFKSNNVHRTVMQTDIPFRYNINLVYISNEFTKVKV